jgi:hypothetical protein
MTAPTPKPDGGPARRRSRAVRLAALVAGPCIAFATVAVALLRVLPEPRSRADYLIMGTLATVAALIWVFVALILGGRR